MSRARQYRWVDNGKVLPSAPHLSVLNQLRSLLPCSYVFWSGLMTGLTLVVVLYTRQYCLENPGVCACRGGGAPVLQP